MIDEINNITTLKDNLATNMWELSPTLSAKYKQRKTLV